MSGRLVAARLVFYLRDLEVHLLEQISAFAHAREMGVNDKYRCLSHETRGRGRILWDVAVYLVDRAVGRGPERLFKYFRTETVSFWTMPGLSVAGNAIIIAFRGLLSILTPHSYSSHTAKPIIGCLSKPSIISQYRGATAQILTLSRHLECFYAFHFDSLNIK